MATAKLRTDSLTVLADRVHETWKQRGNKQADVEQANAELEAAKDEYWQAVIALVTAAEQSATAPDDSSHP